MANPFFSGRIPPGLAVKIDAQLLVTCETRSELLVRLLRAEVGDNQVDNDNKVDNNIDDLIRRVERLEQIITDNKTDNDNKVDNPKQPKPRASRKKPTTNTTVNDK